MISQTDRQSTQDISVQKSPCLAAPSSHPRVTPLAHLHPFDCAFALTLRRVTVSCDTKMSWTPLSEFTDTQQSTFVSLWKLCGFSRNKQIPRSKHLWKKQNNSRKQPIQLDIGRHSQAMYSRCLPQQLKQPSSLPTTSVRHLVTPSVDEAIFADWRSNYHAAAAPPSERIDVPTSSLLY